MIDSTWPVPNDVLATIFESVDPSTFIHARRISRQTQITLDRAQRWRHLWRERFGAEPIPSDNVREAYCKRICLVKGVEKAALSKAATLVPIGTFTEQLRIATCGFLVGGDWNILQIWNRNVSTTQTLDTGIEKVTNLRTGVCGKEPYLGITGWEKAPIERSSFTYSEFFRGMRTNATTPNKVVLINLEKCHIVCSASILLSACDFYFLQNRIWLATSAVSVRRGSVLSGEREDIAPANLMELTPQGCVKHPVPAENLWGLPRLTPGFFGKVNTICDYAVWPIQGGWAASNRFGQKDLQVVTGQQPNLLTSRPDHGSIYYRDSSYHIALWFSYPSQISIWKVPNGDCRQAFFVESITLIDWYDRQVVTLTPFQTLTTITWVVECKGAIEWVDQEGKSLHSLTLFEEAPCAIVSGFSAPLVVWAQENMLYIDVMGQTKDSYLNLPDDIYAVLADETAPGSFFIAQGACLDRLSF